MENKEKSAVSDTVEATETFGNIGSVKISEDVIITIATTAASETEGVNKISTKNAVNPKNLINTLKPAKGVCFTTVSDGIDLTVQISVLNGYKIPEVAQKVQENVSDAVQTMTGINVNKVNVTINNIVAEK